jgi:aspartyl-tRNA(Asn)/glutamyl-tRNA(Gln) amidotransferase subunit A
MNPTDLTIAEAGARLRDGSLTSVALCEAHVERIRARDGALHAFVAVDAESALAEAARADQSFARGVDLGPLHGIPTGLKDLIDVRGATTANGSRVAAHGVAADDAAVVRRLRESGAVIVGKLATYEFALVGPSFDTPFPPVRNPWNLANITGGSSSGPAAAVAGGLLRTSIGTDSGGSIRSPAAYCGVVGLKPTFGLVSVEGVFPLSQSLDHVGPISASVAEAALTLDALVGGQDASWRPAASRLGQPIDGMRIGYARDGFAKDPLTHPGVLRAIDDAASQLSLLGARIEEITLPDYGLCEACGATILHFEALANHEELLRRYGGDYGRLAWLSLAAGLTLTPSDLARARRIASALRDEIDSGAFARCDALLTATTLTPAPPFSAFDGRKAVWTPMRTLPFNVTGHPALTMPAGFAEGLPVGAQIVGRAFDEALICQIADAFERATDFAATPRPFASGAPQAD